MPEDDGELVRRRVDELLAAHPPTTTPERDFWAARFDAGLAWVAFPSGWGGLGLPPRFQGTVDQLLAAADAPPNWWHNPVGLGAVAAALAGYGADEQRRRWLRPIFTTDEVWCQLWTERGAGSDLASLTTSAVAAPGGGAWQVDGHKAYSTLAHVARWGLLLARTHPDRPRHHDLTCFAVDMTASGVEVRPIRTLDGDAELDEVVLTAVVVPDTHRIGPPGEGWSVAIDILRSERPALAGPARRRGEGPIAETVRLWHARPADRADPRTEAVLRDRVAGAWIDAEVTRLLVARLRAADPAVGPEGAMAKLASTEVDQRVWDLCVDLMGPAGTLYDDWSEHTPTTAGESRRDPRRAWLRSRAATIQGGTSEILRTLLAERVLGLPAERSAGVRSSPGS